MVFKKLFIINATSLGAKRIKLSFIWRVADDFEKKISFFHFFKTKFKFVRNMHQLCLKQTLLHRP